MEQFLEMLLVRYSFVDYIGNIAFVENKWKTFRICRKKKENTFQKKWNVFQILSKILKQFSHFNKKIETILTSCQRNWNTFRILSKILKHFSHFVEKIETFSTSCQKNEIFASCQKNWNIFRIWSKIWNTFRICTKKVKHFSHLVKKQKLFATFVVLYFTNSFKKSWTGTLCGS